MNSKNIEEMKYYKRWMMLKSIIKQHEEQVTALKGTDRAVVARRIQLQKLLDAIEKIEEMY